MSEVEQLNLTALTKFVKAVQLLSEVAKVGSAFTDDLLPTATEDFLEQANIKFAELETLLAYNAR